MHGPKSLMAGRHSRAYLSAAQPTATGYPRSYTDVVCAMAGTPSMGATCASIPGSHGLQHRLAPLGSPVKHVVVTRPSHWGLWALKHIVLGLFAL